MMFILFLLISPIAALRLHAIEETVGRGHGCQARISDGPDPRTRRLPEALQQVQGGDGGSPHRQTVNLNSS